MTPGPKGPYRQIVPGLSVDRDGAAVFNVADILAHLGLPDTPENRRLVGEMVEAMVRDVGGLEIIGRLPGDPVWREWPA